MLRANEKPEVVFPTSKTDSLVCRSVKLPPPVILGRKTEYLSWVYASGQDIALAQGYAPLPSSVLQKVRAKVAALK